MALTVLAPAPGGAKFVRRTLYLLVADDLVSSARVLLIENPASLILTVSKELRPR